MILIIIGFFSAILAGMGLGGGVLLIPAVIFFTAAEQTQAQLYSLFAYIPTAVSALIVHSKNKMISWRALAKTVPVGLLGAGVGAYIATNISTAAIRTFYGIFLLIFGTFQIICALREIKNKKRQ